MAYIKSKGWANSSSAGAYDICPGTPGTFECQVGLTKETSPQEWIFREQKEMADVEFRFKQKTSESRFANETSSMMQKPLPREWLLSGESRFRKFDPEMIEKGIHLLRPDNIMMTIVSQDYPGDWDQKEKWYGTEYKSEKIPTEFLAELSTMLDQRSASID
ncbi:Metalloenzyme, LuxS/M16 peptidase-like protein [Nemania serpens]|nr:Metalloenzyme, LuxS/M16 peptidase-like protein [Nemania serpens]